MWTATASLAPLVSVKGAPAGLGAAKVQPLLVGCWVVYWLCFACIHACMIPCCWLALSAGCPAQLQMFRCGLLVWVLLVCTHVSGVTCPAAGLAGQGMAVCPLMPHSAGRPPESTHLLPVHLQAATAWSTAAATAAGSCGAAWRRRRAAGQRWSSRCVCAGWQVRELLCVCVEWQLGSLRERLQYDPGHAPYFVAWPCSYRPAEAPCFPPALQHNRFRILVQTHYALLMCFPLPDALQRRPASRRRCSPAAFCGGRR